MVREWLEFFETVGFTRKLHQIANRETLGAIQSDLTAAPDRWPVAKGTHSARKGRVADPESARGKSRSFRYYYVYLSRRGRVYLLAIYSKSEASDLTADQKRRVASIVAAIEQED
jgi:hypothetical protein